MSQYSVYRVVFKVGNSGPYTVNVALSGGSRADLHSSSITSGLISAITANLAGIFTGLGTGTGTDTHGAPSGTVTIDQYEHAGAPDAWV